MDLNATEFATYQPLPGDIIRVAEILNRFENRVKIEGAVFRPEIYSFYEGMHFYVGFFTYVFVLTKRFYPSFETDFYRESCYTYCEPSGQV